MKWLRSRRTHASSQAEDSVPARARAAFHAGVADAVLDLTRIGDLYVDWVEGNNNATPGERAEAYWMRSVATAREAMHHGLLASQLAVLSSSQRIAAEAGYWLAVDERPADAVVAVEHSRAILLSRLTGGLEPQVRSRLAAEHPELLDSYLNALHRQADAYRGQYSGTDAEIPSIVRAQRSYQAGSASPLEAAQADLARLNRQVNAVIGPLDPLGIPRYQAIAEAARKAPVVYLAAGEEAGYALIVKRDGEPVFAKLPELRSELVKDRAEVFTAPAPNPAAVRECVDWLTVAAREIERRIPDEPEIAVIPLGALNLLPFNAAFIQATADRPAGPVTVRLLPNARLAADAASWPETGLTDRILVVDATRVHGARQLPRSELQAEALTRRYRARWLRDATSQAVLPALDTVDLVHFMCHGEADLTDPFSSGLLLTDGRLTVRTLLARPPLRRQLVILSACESHLGGTAAPDEIIGLPAALFQAGALGVIAAQWRVSERAALLVSRKFYEHLENRTSPARALTAAQRWLRTATLGELTSTYPDLFTVSPAMAAQRHEEILYDRPVDWAAFTYTGI